MTVESAPSTVHHHDGGRDLGSHRDMAISSDFSTRRLLVAEHANRRPSVSNAPRVWWRATPELWRYGDVLSRVWWKDERMLIAIDEHEEQQGRTPFR